MSRPVAVSSSSAGARADTRPVRGVGQTSAGSVSRLCKRRQVAEQMVGEKHARRCSGTSVHAKRAESMEGGGRRGQGWHRTARCTNPSHGTRTSGSEEEMVDCKLWGSASRGERAVRLGHRRHKGRAAGGAGAQPGGQTVPGVRTCAAWDPACLATSDPSAELSARSSRLSHTRQNWSTSLHSGALRTQQAAGSRQLGSNWPRPGNGGSALDARRRQGLCCAATACTQQANHPGTNEPHLAPSHCAS